MRIKVQGLLTLRRAFVVILFGGIFVLAARNITDPDFWWHLRTGQYIVENRSVPHADPFSFTKLGQPWIAHEWLSEVFIYGLYRLAGWGGLIVIFALLTMAIFLFLYWRCGGQPYVAGVLVLLGAFACRPTWGVRPQTISLLLASILLWLLERSDQDRRILWWVVPMTLLWANLHAGYSLGIALLLLWLIGSWLDTKLGKESLDQHAAPLRPLMVTLSLAVLVVMANPNGLRLYSYPIKTLRSSAMQRHIVEWFSPDFHRGELAPFLVLLLAVLVAPALTGLRPSARQLLVLCVSAFAALQFNRFIPIFILVVIPVLSEQGRAWLEIHGWHRVLQPAPGAPFSKALLNAAGMGVLAILAYTHVRNVVRSQPIAEAEAFPKAAVQFLAEHGFFAPYFNNYSWGGYMIWKLPAEKVFVDGRADLYGDDFVEDHFRTYGLIGDWRRELECWKIRTVVVPPTAPIANALSTDKLWREVFRDSQATVFTRSFAAHN